MSDRTPDWTLPRIGADFNACGYSGEPGDTCCYGMDREALRQLPASLGRRILIWESDGEDEVICCEAVLEWYVGQSGGVWRARPDEATWYRGRLPGAEE